MSYDFNIWQNELTNVYVSTKFLIVSLFMQNQFDHHQVEDNLKKKQIEILHNI